MIPFYSKRNQVYPVIWQGQAAVEKHFISLDAWQRETALLAALSGKLPVPKILCARPGVVTMEYCPHGTMLQLLERQEEEGFSPEPWRALAVWLKQCHKVCGQLPEEGNLRNFLWDNGRRRVIGLDMESYGQRALPVFGACFIAALLEYRPADTPVKKSVARFLAMEWGVPGPAIMDERQRLRDRRRQRPALWLSGIVLAGGASRRMGRNKAEILFLGRTMLRWQVEKLQEIGIQDILISGKTGEDLPGTRVVPDKLPSRGPLGGLHACLEEAEHPQCLVLSVDVPLIPTSTLVQLCRAHRGGITVLRHAEKQEPLIGVYDSAVAENIFPLIREKGAPVQALKEVVSWNHFDYLGPEILLKNCNTPQDLSEVSEKAMEFAGCGFLRAVGGYAGPKGETARDEVASE